MMLTRLLLLAGLTGLTACSQPVSTNEAPSEVAAVAADDRAGPASETTAEALPQAFIAFGNEPFWSVRVDGDRLHWSSPENMDGIDFTAQVEQLPTQRDYRGQLQGQAVSLGISHGPCSDGMSDQVHPWRVSWSIDGRVLDGCARIAD